MMDFRIKEWKKLENFHYSVQYKYPGSDLPLISSPEGATLQEFLPRSSDGIFLDYGCGEGVMLKYIKKYYKRLPPLIIAVEPDNLRLAKARQALFNERGKGIFLNTNFYKSNFRKENLQNTLSCIICIQVFGHIPAYQLTETLKTFFYLLNPKGTVIIAVPFVNNQFSFPKWINGTDFFSSVDCTRKPKDPKRRKILSKKEFSNMAENPPKKLLLTRRFFIDEKAQEGYRCGSDSIIVSTLGNSLIEVGFKIKDAVVYKEKPERGTGDLMFSLIPMK